MPPDSEHSDASLVDELRHDSRAALAALFDRHADAIYNYCFRHTRPRELGGTSPGQPAPDGHPPREGRGAAAS